MTIVTTTNSLVGGESGGELLIRKRVDLV